MASTYGVDGKVLEMNWCATHRLTAEGNIVTVPNSIAAKAKIVNSSRPLALHGVSISLEISPEELPLAEISIVLTPPKPYALVKSASANSIRYEVTAYVDDLSRKTHATNELYDLYHRNLSATGIELRPLGLPA